MTYQPTYDSTDKPLRSWDEVVRLFNQKHPDKPLPSENTARQIHSKAIIKLRKKKADELMPLHLECE